MTKGVIFDIKRYAIHDGPGIRTTVFFKGCPLRCQWCHNPEGIVLISELMISQNRCVKICKACVTECLQSALSKNNGRISVDLEKCNLCGQCVEVCAYEALALSGKEVTVSGGEPLEQVPFLLEFFAALKRRDIHMALDTSGYLPFEALLEVSRYVSLFLYDLKMMDNSKHENYTGVPNNLILDNLTKLSEKEVPVEIRLPLIAGINDDEENIRATIEYLLALRQKPKVSLLSYHRGGCEKYSRLGKVKHKKAFQTPSEEHMAKIINIFTEEGFQVKRGG